MNNLKREGEYPAFPTNASQTNAATGYGLESNSGMTKRYVTAMTLLGHLLGSGMRTSDRVVQMAYEYADDLIKFE